MRNRALYRKARETFCARATRVWVPPVAAVTVFIVGIVGWSPERSFRRQTNFSDGIVTQENWWVEKLNCNATFTIQDSSKPDKPPQIFKQRLTPWNKGALGGMSFQIERDGRIEGSYVTTRQGETFDLLRGGVRLAANELLAQKLACARPRMIGLCLDIGYGFYSPRINIGLIPHTPYTPTAPRDFCP